MLHLGVVDPSGCIEQVKGVTYRLEEFVGPNSLKKVSHAATHCESHSRLYHIVIYLAPGDCHHFHSPTEWTMYTRRHFPGKMIG